MVVAGKAVKHRCPLAWADLTYELKMLWWVVAKFDLNLFIPNKQGWFYGYL
jgi:hypothetical protein